MGNRLGFVMGIYILNSTFCCNLIAMSFLVSIFVKFLELYFGQSSPPWGNEVTMSSPSQGDQPTRPEALKKLAQLQIDRLKKEEEEEQWISGEELYTEGSSDDDDTAIRSRQRAGGKARKHRQVAAVKDSKHKEGHNKLDITLPSAGTSGELGVIPPEMRLESLMLTAEESHRCQPEERNMLVTDIDEQIKISWRPKRGSIKLPNLSPDGRVEVVTGTDVVTH